MKPEHGPQGSNRETLGCRAAPSPASAIQQRAARQGRNRNTPSKFGRYMVGCFDVLGQSNKLLEMPRNPKSREEVAPYLKQTADVVLGIRNNFEMFFTAESEFVASLSPHERKHFLDHMRTRRQLRWGFSDTYIVAAPVMHDGDKVLAVVSEIYRTMFAASFMWLASMSAGHPLRGG